MRTAVILALAVLAACGKAAPASEQKPKIVDPPVSVQTAPIQRQKLPRLLTLTGSVIAHAQSEVAANVGGRIVATYVERGQAVKKGDPLALVDARAAGLSASAAKAQSEAAATQVELAQQECARADKLFAEGASTAAEHARARAQCKAQLFSATAAQANADLAKKVVGDSMIRAPIDGVIGERYVNVGEFVQQPSRIASIYAMDPVRVQISVPEAAVAQIREGQTLQLRVGAWGDRTFPARVEYISAALRPNTRDLIVEALASNPDHALRPGMFGTVSLQIGKEEHPTVPVEALRRDGSVSRLFLSREGKAFELVVRTGLEKDGRVAVIEDFEPNDTVILNPPAQLRDGSAIEVSDAVAR